MSTYERFLAQALDLNLAEGPVLEFVADILGRILEVEGPPAHAGDADDHRAEIVKKHNGRAWFWAETWSKGPWRCLLMHAPSLTMGRPITLGLRDKASGDILLNHKGDQLTRTITDSRSDKAKGKIIAACRWFNIDAPIGPCFIHNTLNGSRSFICWRSPNEDEISTWSESLRGDVDNYGKITLDGLQAAGVLQNDRTVIGGNFIKTDPWHGVPAPSLESRFDLQLREVVARGEDPEPLREELGATKKLLKSILAELRPEEHLKRRGRPPKVRDPHAPKIGRGRPTKIQGQALSLYKENKPLEEIQADLNLTDQAMANIFPGYKGLDPTPNKKRAKKKAVSAKKSTKANSTKKAATKKAVKKPHKGAKK